MVFHLDLGHHIFVGLNLMLLILVICPAIEAGALMQSHEGGTTWIDKVNEGPFDTHTMFTHSLAPGYLYCAAGDGYNESTNYGQSRKTSRRTGGSI